ncbi:MAG: ABC transporter permease subunit [Haloarculaceae archaeon]
MLELASYETRRRWRGTAALAVMLAALAALMVAFFPSVQASGVDFETYVASMPPAFRAAFGVEAMTTIGGFLATELYQFAWVLLLGLYFAYLAGGVVASDVERGRMDLLLSTPISRRRVVAEKFLSLLAPMVAVNVVGAVVVYAGTVAVGDPIDVIDLTMVHVLSLPYLLACAAIGLVFSVALHRADTAQRGALGLLFALFLVDSVSVSSDYDWAGALSPTRYYDPTAILVRGEYDWTGAAILLLAAVALVLFAREYFQRVDVE